MNEGDVLLVLNPLYSKSSCSITKLFDVEIEITMGEP
jgi:hypothetical protein